MSVRRVICVFILGVASLYGATPASGKVFYIAGNSTRTTGGASCSDALSVAWFNNTSSWGTASHQISAGTTVYLCGVFNGKPGEQLLLVHGSGAAGNPITIKFLSGTVLSAPYWSSNGAINADNRSHIVIDGGTNGIIQNTANGTGRAYRQQTVAVHASNCTACTVQNLTVQDLYVRTSNSDLAATHTVHCVYFVNSNSFTISHVTCHDACWALAGGGNNLTVEYSNIYHVDHGLAFGASGKQGGFSIHNNHFHDFANWDSPTNTYHHDGIHLWGEYGGTITSGAIYDNTFDGDFGVNITAHIFLQNSIQHVSVYNNTFNTPTYRTIISLWFGAASTSMVGGSAIGNSAYNNSINAGGHKSGSALYADNQLEFTAVNNILVGGSSDISVARGSTLSSIGINHNLYRDLYAEFGDNNTLGWKGFVYHYLAAWRPVCHCDGNSTMTTSAQTAALEPTTMSTPEALSTQAGTNPTQTLSTDSVAGAMDSLASQGTGAGLNLSEIATGELSGLAFDKNGKERPAAGPWNIGPY